MAGEVRIVSCIEEPEVIERILHHLDHTSSLDEHYADHPGRDPPQLDFFA